MFITVNEDKVNVIIYSKYLELNLTSSMIWYEFLKNNTIKKQDKINIPSKLASTKIFNL